MKHRNRCCKMRVSWHPYQTEPCGLPQSEKEMMIISGRFFDGNSKFSQFGINAIFRQMKSHRDDIFMLR